MIRRPPRSTLFPLHDALPISHGRKVVLRVACRDARRATGALREIRSEEHTSELQSRSDLVCRLLLEKKKTHSRVYNSSFRNHECTRRYFFKRVPLSAPVLYLL